MIQRPRHIHTPGSPFRTPHVRVRRPTTRICPLATLRQWGLCPADTGRSIDMDLAHLDREARDDDRGHSGRRLRRRSGREIRRTAVPPKPPQAGGQSETGHQLSGPHDSLPVMALPPWEDGEYYLRTTCVRSDDAALQSKLVQQPRPEQPDTAATLSRDLAAVPVVACARPSGEETANRRLRRPAGTPVVRGTCALR